MEKPESEKKGASALDRVYQIVALAALLLAGYAAYSDAVNSDKFIDEWELDKITDATARSIISELKLFLSSNYLTEKQIQDRFSSRIEHNEIANKVIEHQRDENDEHMSREDKDKFYVPRAEYNLEKSARILTQAAKDETLDRRLHSIEKSLEQIIKKLNTVPSPHG